MQTTPRVAAPRNAQTSIAKATRADHVLKRTATRHAHRQRQASRDQIARNAACGSAARGKATPRVATRTAESARQCYDTHDDSYAFAANVDSHKWSLGGKWIRENRLRRLGKLAGNNMQPGAPPFLGQGVRQGDPLPSLLWAVYIRKVMRVAEEQQHGINEVGGSGRASQTENSSDSGNRSTSDARSAPAPSGASTAAT